MLAKPRLVKRDAKKDLPSPQGKLESLSDPNPMYTRLEETTSLLNYGEDPFRFLNDQTHTITTKSTSLLSCMASTLASIAATLESTSDRTLKPSQDSIYPHPKNLSLSMLQDKKNEKLKKF